MDDLCIHELDPAYCSICKGNVRVADPRAVAGALKAAASRAGRVALPPKRFGQEVDAAVAALRSAGESVTVSAVQRIIAPPGTSPVDVRPRLPCATAVGLRLLSEWLVDDQV